MPAKRIRKPVMEEITLVRSKNSPYSLDSFLTFIQNNFVLIIAVLLVFMLGFFVGSLWNENKMLRTGKVGVTPNVLGAAAAPVAPTAPAGPTDEQLNSLAQITNDDHVRGAKNAKVTLIEYSDLNCGFCKKFHPTLEAVVEKYGNDVAWTYRHLPILGSQKEAEATECAAKLGGDEAFWSYIDGYFADVAGTAGAHDETAMAELAGKLGLNQASFTQCLSSGEMEAKVTAVSEAAQAIGLTSTIVVSSKGDIELIPGALPDAQVKATIEKYL